MAKFIKTNQLDKYSKFDEEFLYNPKRKKVKKFKENEDFKLKKQKKD